VFQNGLSDVKYARSMSAAEPTAAGLPPAPRPPRPDSAAAARRAPRQRSLTKQAIVDAALAIVDEEGLDALTMRAVAARLGTGPASLYAHVASKDELIEAVVEQVIGEIDFDEAADPERWFEQLLGMGRRMRAMYAGHRDLARASFARIPLGENALAGSEWMIAVMRAGGLSDRAIGLGVDLFALYIGAVAYEESLESVGEVAPEEIAEFVAELRGYLQSLPADRFPGVVALAAALTEADGDERFEFGLEVLIRGLIAVSERES
jgi:AcrR family transcriptional regulator